MKKEFILEAKNTGRLFGKNFLKQRFDDEDRVGNVNCEVLLSDKKDFEVKEGEKIKVTLEKLVE